MHKIMDAYVDDILVKSKEEEDHIDALSQVFKRFILFKLQAQSSEICFQSRVRQATWFHGQQKGDRSRSR